MTSRLSDEKLEKKFMQVSNSQDSIQTLSLWLIYHKSQTKKIVEIWLKTLKKSKIPHRLVLFYVANDVIQTCKRKAAPQFAEAFSEVLAEATLLVRDEKIRPNVERVFNVWDQRNIYAADFIEGLRNILVNSKVQTMQPKFVAEFKPQKVMDKIRKIKKIELESVTKLSAVTSSKLDCSSSEIINQLKDRTHGHQIVHEYDETVHCLQEYLEILEKEVVERTQLIELLEKGEIFYNAQNGEVKVVANAYRTFAGRVKGLKKKLDDLYPTLPSPIPSPCSDAPSPTPSEEGPIMSPLSESNEEVKEEQEEELPKTVAVVTTPEKKRIEIKQELEEKKQNLPLIGDAPSPEPSPKQLPSTTVPLSQSLHLSQGTMTPPVTAKLRKPPDSLEEQASGMMTSWLSALNANNQTFTKAFSLDSRVPQTGSLESRLSSLMESLPNLPQVFRTANYETQIPSSGSTPIRADQGSINSPANINSPVIQATTYVENQSDNDEPGTPVNDENRRDATPVEDEDTRFSVGNTLPLASVMSSLSNEDLHQSLLKSLSHLQQLSASNTPPSVTQIQKVSANEPCNTPVSAASSTPHDGYHQNTSHFAKPDYHQNTPFMKPDYHQNNPPFTKPDYDLSTPFTKPDTSFNSSLPTIPSYLRTSFNLNDIQNAPSIFSAASKLSFPSLSSEPPSPSEEPTKVSNLTSPSHIYDYATNIKDEAPAAVPPMQTDQSYNKQDFNTEEENLEPMDMDLDESDEEENCSNIIEGVPPTSGDVDLRVPPVPQKTAAVATSWSSCVAAVIPPVSHQNVTAQPELQDNSNSDQHPLETVLPQHHPVQDMHHFSQSDLMTDQKLFKNKAPNFSQKCYKDEDLRHHNTNIRHQNAENITPHHMDNMDHYNEVRHHNVEDVRHHNINDRRHHDVNDGRIQNINDGRHHNFSDGRHQSFDDGSHHNANDERLHNNERRHFTVDDGKHLGVDDRRYHSVSEGRFHVVDSGRPCNIDDVSHHKLDDLSHHNVNDTSHHNINDASHHNVSDTSHHSVDDTSHHSIDSASHHSADDARHSVDDVKHHNPTDMRHHNIKDIHQYNFEEVKQQNYGNLTPHSIENVGQYSTGLLHSNISERHDSVENQNFQGSTENGGNQNIGVSHNVEDIQCHEITYRETTERNTTEDTGHKKSPYVEEFSGGVVADVRHHSMPYAERSSETVSTTVTPTTTVNTSESSYYPDNYEQQLYQQPVPTQMTEQCPATENRIQTVQSVRQNSEGWKENWNEEPWERQNPHGPMRRRGQPYFRPRFPDYQNRYPQDRYHPYARRNNYRPRFPVPPFNPRFPPPTHLIPGGRGNFPPRY